MRSETLEILGRPVTCWRGGAGAPLLLLHGGMGDAALHFAPIWDGLAEGHTVIAPDLPGFGGSRTLARTTFPDLVAWIDALLDQLGAQRVSLVGADIGAALARAYAAARPGRAQSLVLIGGGALPGIFERQWSRMTLGVGATRGDPRAMFSKAQLSTIVSNPAVLTDEFVSRCQANGAVGPMMSDLSRGPAPRRRPAAPTLVLWGEDDLVLPPAVGERITAEMAHAAFRLLRRCGHLPAVESPQQVLEALLAFLG